MERVLWEGDTSYGHYQVVEERYNGRPARLLYSGDHQAAQSGTGVDDRPELLFDYNQRLFELASGLAAKRVLLIGGGAFTLPTALLSALPGVKIDVIELDPGLPELARQYFSLPTSDRLRIFTTDGQSFLHEQSAVYDLIIVDAYTHDVIPQELKTLEAFTAYRDHLMPSGVFAMNVISTYHGNGVRPLLAVCTAAQQTFQTVDVFLASRGYSLYLPQNFVLVAQKGAVQPVSSYLHGVAVEPPKIIPD